jgi:hypothetical protein
VDRTATRFAVWVLLGSLLLQSAWVLALPPFRGSDEFDHAYRAASVARGEWLPSGQSTSAGRGELLTVPADIVRAAGPVCRSLDYTGEHNCGPAETLPDGRVVVASAASRYNPVFYWVLGTAARPFDGAAALYAMRAVNLLLCSVVLAGAAWVTGRWSRTVWPRLGLVAAVTPVTAYGGAVAAPNALEVAAALGVWTALLGLRRVEGADRGRLLVLAGLFAVPLAGLRALGPLWLALVLLLAAAWLGPRLVAAIARAHPRASAAAAGLALVGVAGGAGWTLLAGMLSLEDTPGEGDPWLATAASLPLWLLQSVAAFPLRNERAPMVVYATGVLVLGGILVLGLLRGGRRDRAVVLLALLVSVGVPFLLQVQAHEAAGPIWQGRYGWPLGAGVLLLAAAAVDRRPPEHPLVAAGITCGAGLWVLAHAVGVVGVLLDERRDSPLAGDDRWLSLPPAVVAVLAAGGVVAWAFGAAGRPSAPASTAVPGEPVADLAAGGPGGG